ncbi:serotonin receptor-like protein [Leptotrombidium deliense]|uniref:Serotonin receptor-like protein n=1 Tax=Leptotrombidium deliense TaxID=299467 RepID=A0A443SDC9_9ACAR|nr:serotonin receptor-like protein [Leptotrombidium deliense]
MCKKVAKKRIRHKPGKNITLKVTAAPGTVTVDTTSERTIGSTETETVNSSYKETAFKNQVESECSFEKNSIKIDEKCATNSRKTLEAKSANVNNTRETIEAKRERKAVKTLTIITGAFVGCWFPFFVVALLMPICGELCNPGEVVLTVILWLGWVNSMLNPIIYTIFSPDFRAAFNRILLGRKPNYNRPCNV